VGNRRLYGMRSFDVSAVLKHSKVWHVVGKYDPSCVKSKYANEEYRIRVAPDPRWDAVTRISFCEERVYESESIAYVTNRHTYGSGRWYISPYCEGPRSEAIRQLFTFEDFKVVSPATG
jgi:hypothetical protein